LPLDQQSVLSGVELRMTAMGRDRLAQFWSTSNVGHTSSPVVRNVASGTREDPLLAVCGSSRLAIKQPPSGR
jgi:hypothetical protein